MQQQEVDLRSAWNTLISSFIQAMEGKIREKTKKTRVSNRDCSLSGVSPGFAAGSIKPERMSAPISVSIHSEPKSVFASEENLGGHG